MFFTWNNLFSLRMLFAFVFVALLLSPQIGHCAVVANYRFDECHWDGSADEVEDSSGNGNHGTAINDAHPELSDGSGGMCNVGQFDGVGDYVEISDNPSLNPTGSFTASVWFRADSLGSWNGVVTKLTNVNLGTGRGWNIQVGNHQRIASLMADGNGDYVYLRSTTIPQTGVWYHVVLVHQADNTNHLYVNGHQEATNNHAIAFTSNPLHIGKFYTNTGSLAFDGSIDEVELYDNALDASEVQTLYANLQAQKNSDGSQRYCSCANAIGEYYFNEEFWTGTSGEVRDASSGLYHATAVNGAMTEDISPAISGNPGTCNYGVFDGVDDYVGLPSNYPDLTSDFTITAWIRTTDKSRSGQRIFIDDPNNTGGFGFSLGDGGAGRVRFFSRQTNPIILDSQPVIENNTWYFVAAVADITNNTKRIYIFDQAGNQLDTVSQSYTGIWGSDSGDASIGGENSSSTETGSRFHFVGNIDEVKVHDRALNVTQLNDLRTMTHGCAVDPVAEYRLDDCGWDGTVGEVTDSSGYNHHGTAMYDANTVDNDSLGGICRAGFFDGSEDYVEIPDNPILNPAGGFTASVWFRADSLGSWNGVVTKLTNVNGGHGQGWNIQVGRSNHIASLMADQSGHYQYLQSTTVPQVGQWYHVVLVHQANDTNRLYVNGRQEAVNHHAIAFTSNPFQIGKFYTNGSGLVFDGAIDEVELYNDVLDNSQIQILYENQLAHKNHDGSPRFCPCSASAEYRFDVCTETDFIIDDSGNGFNGRVQNGPLAIELGKVCNGGRFDGVDDYIEVDASDKFDNTGALTIAGWIKPQDIRINPPTGNARGIISKRNNQSAEIAYGVFFYTVMKDGKIYVDLDTQDDRFASNAVIPEDTWTHFAVVFDGSLSVDQRAKLYINGTLDKVAPETSTVIPDYNSNLYIGNLYTGPTQLKVYKGLIDEMRVIPAALSSTDIQALYNDTRLGCQVCGTVDHYRIEHTGFGLTCQPSEIKLRACADPTCNAEFADPVTVTMSPRSANPPVWLGGGDTKTFTGSTDIKLRQTTAGTVAVGISHPNPIPDHNYKCFNAGVEGDCNIIFSDTGFVFDVPDLTACQDSANISLQAVRTDDTTKTCVADGGFANTSKTVNFWSDYVVPATGSEQLSLNGTVLSTLSPGTGIPLSFNVNASADLVVNYPDAGQLQLNARYEGIGVEEAGLVMVGADSFVTRPVGLCVYSDDANSDCTAGNGSCSVFKKVGEMFNLKVKGVCWESSADTDFCSGNVTTPNFRLNSITISHNLIAPVSSGASPGTISVSSINMTAADSGEHVAHQTVSEVGVYTFTATPPNYFGQSLPAATSTNIGRFIPDHFSVSILDNGIFEDGCSGFTYSGQPFSYSAPNFPEMEIAATGVGGNTLVNYRDDFVKLTQTTQINMPAVSADASQLGNNGTLLALTWNPAGSALVVNNDGTLNFTLGGDEFIYTRDANALVSPFVSDIKLEVTAVTDHDGVSAAGMPISFTPTGTMVRYGRMQLQNSYGPETLPLTIPVLTEYYDGSHFVPNSFDSCTSYDALQLTFSNNQGNLDLGETLATGSGVLLSGVGTHLTLSAPGTGNDGSVDVMLDLSSATGSGLEWLLPSGNNPEANATFGIFKGNTHLIYMRESVW